MRKIENIRWWYDKVKFVKVSYIIANLCILWEMKI